MYKTGKIVKRVRDVDGNQFILLQSSLHAIVCRTIEAIGKVKERGKEEGRPSIHNKH